MSKQDRIFADDWRDCLAEQYKAVIRQRDMRTEATLTQVLHEVGFRNDELNALKLEATIRAEDMPGDYVPDAVQQQYYAGVDVPPAAESIVPIEDVIEEDLIEADVTYEELIAEETTDVAGESDLFDEPDEPDAPQQLSLF